MNGRDYCAKRMVISFFAQCLSMSYHTETIISYCYSIFTCEYKVETVLKKIID